MAEPFLIVGLGNPGPKYRHTRHNIGFNVVDALARRWNLTFTQKYKGEFAQHGGAILLKPLTFMNRSGESVKPAAHFYKLPPASILVITDDIDLPEFTLRLRMKGGSGGHNGLKSVTESLGTDEYPRLRIGVGRSDRLAPADHVLTEIPAFQRADYEAIVDRAADGVEACLKEGVAKAMNVVNLRSETK